MKARAATRRTFLKRSLAAAALVPMPAIAQGQARVVVVGGGFAGATCAREIKRLAPDVRVILVETNPTFTACPFSNGVITGLREMRAQRFNYEALGGMGIGLAFVAATRIDPQARTVTLSEGTVLPYDRLVLAPGIDFRWGSPAGYDEAASGRMPHAWKAGEQTLLLRRQLESMEDGGLVTISAPPNPMRCPTGVYERASLIAYYLKTRKPRSKLIILDAKESFPEQRLFQAAWQQLYPGLLEWVPLSNDGKVVSVEPATNTLVTDFDRHAAAVANVIPPQKAGAIAGAAGVADRTGWCPIDPVTFESPLQHNVHVIGDAAISGAMAKSAFAANAQGKACAAAVVTLLAGETPPSGKLINTCYSLVAPDYGISIVAVYQPVNGQYVDVEGAGGTSPAEAPRETRAAEANYAAAWFRTITAEVFG
ncbi:MAG TPA: NAD(P)/FAD-dependent oxidoreductase [Xanthobacteraceae bacterium]|jgi:NADPH-dependent 2,4-dienoyl-CoA reductase/sulfur reductase-like enzyme|nr:NAD(P)/FAD-dependent oxidoreductase [Xanthobacteraceae bacterium]